MDWSSLITQIPALGAFIWFTLELQKRYQESMDKRDERYLEALDKISERIETHDQRVDERIRAVQTGAKRSTKRVE
ncbi:MAG: hypothetical protein GYA58_03355 [Anaerolineaceae bacterium]|nr:hypothetical protein [Anaerolineaceae bacterium]